MKKLRFVMRLPENANYLGQALVEKRMLKLAREACVAGPKVAARRSIFRVKLEHELGVA
jgi:hypothetical protein